ncbi:hypothetical protein TIFTF001_004670 [Ficus carica]|uniref:Uncharacterized protein n=1 Tax=Ficus carica TaxID=3494 RepID=A0AA88CWD8_FICCA|nr:hypothetical protein TIFTF001_004670 [Ficus carica]
MGILPIGYKRKEGRKQLRAARNDVAAGHVRRLNSDLLTLHISAWARFPLLLSTGSDPNPNLFVSRDDLLFKMARDLELL